MSRSRAERSTHVGMTMHEVTVTGVQTLTPHLRRITLGGPSLKGLADDGPDQRFKLLLPRPHQQAPLMPTEPEWGWYQEWLEMPAGERPVLRTYTVRALRPDDAEIDVDIVLHEGADGPGSRWAKQTGPGDQVAIFGSYAEYETEPSWRQLLAGDHTALPAIAAILEQLDDEARADVLVEVPGPEDRLDLVAPAGAAVRWVEERPGEPGAALVDAVRDLSDEPEQPEGSQADRWDYAWVCGEQKCAAALRRHLVRDLGMARDRVMFMGYWRRGGAIDVDPADAGAFAEAVQEAEDADSLEGGD